MSSPARALTSSPVDEIIEEIENVHVTNDEFNSIFDKYDDCEGDIEDKKYQHWVEEHPEHIAEIFGRLILVTELTAEDVQYFVDHGLDLDEYEPSNIYPTDSETSNPLHTACEFRKYNNIKALLEAKADVNSVSDQSNGFTCNTVETTLLGHSCDDTLDYKSTEEIVKLLIDHGACTDISSEILNEYDDDSFGTYKENSELLCDIIAKSSKKRK